MTTRSGDLPDPGDRGVERYSQRPLPRYRYVPGVQPHPVRDPAGHSYSPTPERNRHPSWSVDEWRTSEDWLYGVDLFNRFYFWEAHEAWEGLWAAAPRDTPSALLLQGLIQIAAALLKTHMLVPAGARTLSTEGIEKVRRVAVLQPQMLGLDLQDVVRRFEVFFAPLQDGELPVIDHAVPTLRLQLAERAHGWPGQLPEQSPKSTARKF